MKHCEVQIKVGLSITDHARPQMTELQNKRQAKRVGRPSLVHCGIEKKKIMREAGKRAQWDPSPI
jgi:hypothetical protein